MLDTVSMWMDGASANYAAQVGRLLPGVHLDGKGVFATESVVTLRISGHGCVPALTSAFIEFMDSDKVSLAHQLEPGASYRVVITTPGGLYRYDLGDELLCDSVDSGVPHLSFVGRAGMVSDLVGEKLTDSFVAGALATIDCAASLVPQSSPNPHYELWLDADESGAGTQYARRVDALLKTNPQYSYARHLGQLREPVAICAPGFSQFRARRPRSARPAFRRCEELRADPRPHNSADCRQRSPSMKVALISPKGPLYRNRGGIFRKSLRYQPLTLTTLAALVPPELDIRLRTARRRHRARFPLDLDADLIGMTVITGSAPRAYELARALRRARHHGGARRAARHADAGRRRATRRRHLRRLCRGNLAAAAARFRARRLQPRYAPGATTSSSPDMPFPRRELFNKRALPHAGGVRGHARLRARLRVLRGADRLGTQAVPEAGGGCRGGHPPVGARRIIFIDLNLIADRPTRASCSRR